MGSTTTRLMPNIISHLLSFTLASTYAIAIHSLLIPSTIGSPTFSNSSLGLSLAESGVLIYLVHHFSHRIRSGLSIIFLAITLASLKLPLFTLVHRYFTSDWISDFVPSLLIDAISYFGQIMIHIILISKKKGKNDHQMKLNYQKPFGNADPIMLIISLILVTLAGGVIDYVSERLILRPKLFNDLQAAERRAELEDYFLLSPRVRNLPGMTLNDTLPTMAIVQLLSFVAVTIPVWLITSSVDGSGWLLLLVLGMFSYLVRLPINSSTAISMAGVVIGRVIGSAGLLSILLVDARRGESLTIVEEKLSESKRVEEVTDIDS
ncbi:hypothetical protein CROQUDRAFT_653401 [Cronartium quercuum f. sp. fusiforme G11]|uniref:Uncharacterized protein n=1 Tax=Cronartium quercuum f. sp. fusiforme G11 TaxID=708437 RepID=A0A9P6TF63_9BASI|nr:hypothetical protein CROQUDRAFT_653401 [Cronartium quercuum f. sp. fusiforme G11]